MKRGLIWGILLAVWTVLLVLPNPSAQLDLNGLMAENKYWLAKFVHVCAYACLTVLGGWARAPLRQRWVLVFVLMAHGTVTELIQLRVEGRHGSLGDVGFDNLGVFLGLLAAWKWWSDPV